MATNLRFLTKVQKNVRLLSTTPKCNDKWLSKLLVRKIEPTKESHSRMLSDKEVVFALQTHNFRADSREKYLKNVKNCTELIGAKKELENVQLVGSWTVSVGDQDQALHLWQYNGGFEMIDTFKDVLGKSHDYQKLMEEQGKLVRSRHLQYKLAFSYWPQIKARKPSHIYEVRSYALKPGTMIEWGNNWARAINHRKNNDEAFAGFFSQIGRLYNVHHFWCFESFRAKADYEETTYGHEIWDKVKLFALESVSDMESVICEPTDFSPTQ